MWITYRHHPDPLSWRTEIVLCVDDRPPVTVKFPSVYDRHSMEDARLFMFRGKPHISATISRSRMAGQSFSPCITGYGELAENGTVSNWVEPKVGKNDWTGQEKNHIHYEHDGKLHLIYRCAPEHIVHQLDDKGVSVKKYVTRCPPCSFGEPRGGTQSFPFGDGKRLRFFHTNQVNDKSDMWWTYHLAALVMEDRPPFQILNISKHPILSGNEQYFPGHKYCKARVCIAYGAVEDGDGWLVSLGRNDSACEIAHIGREHLNL